MRAAATILVPGALLLAACSTLTPSNPEIAWQAINAIDMAQTITIARRPSSIEEIGFPTSEVIGKHPSERAVERYAVAGALAHYAVSTWLDRQAEASGSQAWQWARRVWYAATIGYSSYNVAHNAARGIPLFGSREKRQVAVPDASAVTPYCLQTPTPLNCRPIG